MASELLQTRKAEAAAKAAESGVAALAAGDLWPFQAGLTTHTAVLAVLSLLSTLCCTTR